MANEMARVEILRRELAQAELEAEQQRRAAAEAAAAQHQEVLNAIPRDTVAQLPVPSIRESITSFFTQTVNYFNSDLFRVHVYRAFIVLAMIAAALVLTAMLVAAMHPGVLPVAIAGVVATIVANGLGLALPLVCTAVMGFGLAALGYSGHIHSDAHQHSVTNKVLRDKPNFTEAAARAHVAQNPMLRSEIVNTNVGDLNDENRRQLAFDRLGVINPRSGAARVEGNDTARRGNDTARRGNNATRKAMLLDQTHEQSEDLSGLSDQSFFAKVPSSSSMLSQVNAGELNVNATSAAVPSEDHQDISSSNNPV